LWEKRGGKRNKREKHSYPNMLRSQSPFSDSLGRRFQLGGTLTNGKEGRLDRNQRRLTTQRRRRERCVEKQSRKFTVTSLLVGGKKCKEANANGLALGFEPVDGGHRACTRTTANESKIGPQGKREITKGAIFNRWWNLADKEIDRKGEFSTCPNRAFKNCQKGFDPTDRNE